jgi:pyrimidine operon attenuation protein/uracil phosphoribosyltransferase
VKKIILEQENINKVIKEIAQRIVQNNTSLEHTVLVGIRTGGEFLAVRLQEAIGSLGSSLPPIGILDITLYRDDWTKIGPTPVVRKTELPFSVDDQTVILVDDVIFTGRTVRAAMDALMDYGRPKKIELAVLVDRGERYRELPINANYRGGIWDTSLEETINVYLEEEGYHDHVVIEEKKAA